MDVSNIPIIIISYNRFTYLKQLVDLLLNSGEKNIVIIDNNSTYDKLIKYLDEVESDCVKVYKLKQNFGHVVLWKSGLFNEITNNNYYIYTDPDIYPLFDFNHNWKQDWIDILLKYNLSKVGCSISIDDIPEHFKLKDEVISHERQFWSKSYENDVYNADIDTTFALYKPNCQYVYGPSARLGKYRIKHLPWYIDYQNISEEDSLYLKLSTSSTHWTKKLL